MFEFINVQVAIDNHLPSQKPLIAKQNKARVIIASANNNTWEEWKNLLRNLEETYKKSCYLYFETIKMLNKNIKVL